MSTFTPSIRCNACHDPDRCPQCIALNAERDAKFGTSQEQVMRIIGDEIAAIINENGHEYIATEDKELSEIGFDETDAHALTLRLESAFSVQIDDDDITVSSTFRDICILIGWLLRNKAAGERRALEITKAWKDFPGDASSS